MEEPINYNRQASHLTDYKRAVSELIRYLNVHSLPVSHFIGARKRQKANGVYISLTSMPKRLESLKITLKSLLDQTFQPEKIFLNLTEESYLQASWIEKLRMNTSLIDVHIVDKDLGPATKLLPTLQRVPKTSSIIVVDDDQIYPKRLVETYWRQSKILPASVLCMVGWKTPATLNHVDRQLIFGAAYRLVLGKCPVREPTEVDIIQGASSYLVKPTFFDDAVMDYSRAPQAAFFVDDIWFSGHLARKKIKKYVIPGDFTYCRLSSWIVSRETELSRTVNIDKINNNLIYEFFKNDWRSMK